MTPRFPGALFDLGNAYYKLGRLDQAVLQYEKAFAQESSLWPAINNVGLVKYEQGEIDTAISKWRQAIKIDPKAAEPLLALAVGLYTKGEAQEALSLGETALRLDGRYAEFDYLKENLWGDRLINDTQKFLANPQIQKVLVEVKDTQPPSPSP
ncbi:MAG: tetratricopeptide repeat protein [Planktothrix sp. GU0601_MAG3]|nr:MAG: tetratricopeptide repeat protein [Planktothrix sp. GU0601_MAG3]